MRISETEMRSVVTLIFVALVAQCIVGRQQGRSWQRLSAPTVSGGQFSMKDEKSKLVLIAFLVLAEKDGAGTSRATAVVLESLAHQYRGRGLHVVAIDASATFSHKISQHTEVVNRAADWNLEIQVLEDPYGSRARSFGICRLPTMVLISADGVEISRWEGYTRTPVLAQAIERRLGGPLGKLPDEAAHPER